MYFKNMATLKRTLSPSRSTKKTIADPISALKNVQIAAQNNSELIHAALVSAKILNRNGTIGSHYVTVK